MDDLKDILLDGEEVLWSGKPVLTHVKNSSIKKKLKHLAWMLFAALVAAYFFYVGNMSNQTGFVQVLSGITIILIAIGLVIATFAFFDKGSVALSSLGQIYAVTNRRVIVIDTKKHWRQFILGRSVIGLSIKNNGEYGDVHISYGDEDFLSMSALPDADVVERLLLENFAAKRE